MTTYNYTGAMEDVNLSGGRYLIECYGAQGGNDYGLGGYAAGEIDFSEDVALHLFIGGHPTAYNTAGFNGGGGCDDAWGGGGGTDIRINGTAIADRIIVAGGAGGSKNGPVVGIDGGQTLDTDHQLFQGYTGPWSRSGGGGGYRGGYSNGWYNDPGEGGSSYVDTEAFEEIVMTPGVNAGHGYIVITALSVPKKIKRRARII